ncbi:homocysteine S-methyltransferase family protein [uncultured Roseobacter sp.]|uniref:homocysteine S-methyltransferase family protein n=1 Tax=uncultured Roseobacter sp. TaxID=114847 RepID=UPI002634856C|nr:homocysteine S-methyltransferase family protein [uncultured Roseobacter sp.]
MRLEKFANTSRFYLSDGGLETYMIFEKGFDLPCFSAASLLDDARGRAELTAYAKRYITLARETGRGFVLDTPTWRAGAAWADALGMSLDEVIALNARAVDFMRVIRDRHETSRLPILLNGVVGPGGDAYTTETQFQAEDARELHSTQITALADAGVDMISAMTLTHAGEAAGIALAARDNSVPVVISFTLETDGHLPSGQPLPDAIAEVDAITHAGPLYYMINCAHPDHFRDAMDGTADWAARIGGVRANASRMSHAELDASETLDAGDPEELGALNGELLSILPNLKVIGGCCGTDHRHVGCIAAQHRKMSAA